MYSITLSELLKKCVTRVCICRISRIGIVVDFSNLTLQTFRTRLLESVSQTYRIGTFYTSRICTSCALLEQFILCISRMSLQITRKVHFGLLDQFSLDFSIQDLVRFSVISTTHIFDIIFDFQDMIKDFLPKIIQTYIFISESYNILLQNKIVQIQGFHKLSG